MAKKSQSSKKRAARKSEEKSPPGKGPSQRDRLEQELIESVKQIDAEGLIFLLKQAQVIIHNAQVDKLNREAAELEGSDNASGAATLSTPAGEPQVNIEDAGNGKAFFLTINGVRKILDIKEMKRFVQICYSAESKSAALRQLYTVLRRDRADILSDAGISGPGSSSLDAFFYTIRSKFQLKGGW